MSVTADALAKKADSITGGDDESIARNRATVAGGLVGGMLGMYYGFSKGKSIVVMGLIGAVGGAILTRLTLPK